MLRLTMFLVLTVVALPSWGENPPVFDDKWGSVCNVLTSGPCIGLFFEPYDIAVAPNGDIYVSDTLNQRIQKFDSNGNFILQWGSFCNISNSLGCIDPDGGGPLQVGDGQFFDPVGLTVDIDGNVYVAEYSNHRMQKFDSNGNFLMKIGTQGVGTGLNNPGQFVIADDVVIDSNKNIYIADKMNNRVQKFNQTGTFLHAWGTQGLAAGQFMNPVGLAIDMSDNIFVADWNGHRIQKFDVIGTPLTMWGANGANGTMGTGPGEFNQPVHLGIDFFGNVYVPDSNNHRIQKFDGNGTFLSEWGTLCDIGAGGCPDPDGLGGPLQPGDGHFHSPEGVAVNRFINDPMAAIYVADTFNSRIQKFLPDPGGTADCDCATAPPADTAAFKVGVAREVVGNPDQIDVPLLVHTSEDITFSQMRIEYDSACLTFVSAAVGDSVNTPGAPIVDDAIGAVTAGLDRHLQLNATGTYTGCNNEVFVVRFEFALGSTPPCDVDWDPTLNGPNSNNHLNYDNTGGGDGKILPDEITFCEGQVEPFPCPNCVTPGPPADTAVFKVGTPVFLPANQVQVPLLVDTREDATFTQMRLEFDSTCLAYVSTTVGGDVTNPGGLFAFSGVGANNVGVDRHVQINVSGDYTDCEQQVFLVTFAFQPGHTPPCVLLWDQTLGGPNSNSHLNYDNAGGGDGKILPTEITFCDESIAGPVCDSDVSISGTVEYYSNNMPILDDVPDNPGSAPVTVEECSLTPSTFATSPLGFYSLSFGPGPVSVDLCASRPMAACGSNEDGVISGDDIIVLQDSLITGFANPKQQVAADVTNDTLVNLTDLLALKRWVARKVCDGTDGCGINNNCAATWRFLFFPDPADPNNFEVDMLNLVSVCQDSTINIEGVFLGDVDGSWPNFFPKASVPVPLTFEIKGWQQDVVEVALTASLQPGQSLRHVIYSLDYDAASFEYLGLRLGNTADNWEFLDNPDVPGAAHGIAHMPAHSPGITKSGEVAIFRFRPRGTDVATRLSFSRLRTNDVDVSVPEIQLRHGDGTVTQMLPTRYSMSVGPNPFNPSTTISFTIPAGTETAPVQLRIYNISGRLVRTVLHAPKGPGFHQAHWNGKDDNGGSVSAGVYLARIHAGQWSAVEKLALVK